MIKNRTNSIRTKDKDGYTMRAGCICFRTEQEKEVLLVSSCRHPGRWVVPSGGVEPGEDTKEAAIREVVEEVSDRRPCNVLFILTSNRTLFAFDLQVCNIQAFALFVL